MKNRKIILQKLFLIAILFVLIIFTILLLINNFILQEYNSIKYIPLIFLGFLILISGLYLLFNLKLNKPSLKFNSLSENLMKIILIILMSLSFLCIPPITFSSTIIAWQMVGFLNLLRAIIFIIGCSFLPGSCLFNLIFTNTNLHKRFRVELFLLKITLYPLLSFIFLGILTLIFDQIGLTREIITLFLFLSIIILFFIDIISQKLKEQKLIKQKFIELSISRSTCIILITALGIILFSTGIALGVGYLIPGDSWVVIAHANYIGLPEASLDASWSASKNYPIFWSYSTFALSVLSGLPYINANVLLTPFLYLFITTIYIFFKAILQGFKEKWVIFSTFITITYSGIINIFQINDINKKGNISAFIFDGVLNFRYKSFSIFLFFCGLALFIIMLQKKGELKEENIPKFERFKIFNLGALFLIVSYITYMLPLLFGMLITFFYILFRKTPEKYLNFKYYSQFLLHIIGYFIIVDIIMNFYISEITIHQILVYFSFLPINNILNILPNYIFAYFLLFLLYISIFSIRILFLLLYRNKIVKINFKLKINSKILFLGFIFFLLIFINFLIIFLFSIIYEELYLQINNGFLIFYLNSYIFSRIGIIGIFGILFSYFGFINHKRIFIMLAVWIILVLIIASYSFLLVLLSFFPSIPNFSEAIATLTNYEYNLIFNWFIRTWYYTIPAFAILITLILIELSKKLKKLKIYRFRIYRKIVVKNIFITVFVFFSITNILIAGIYWKDLRHKVKDEEAQIIGWASKNIPDKSNILIDADFDQHLIRTLDYEIYHLANAVEKAYRNYFKENYSWWAIIYNYDLNCSLTLLDDFKGHQKVIKFDDQNDNGYTEITFNFNKPQEFGTIEYYILSTNSSNRFWSEMANRGIDGVHLWNGNFTYYNGSDYIKLQPYVENTWYHIKIDFECTDGNYKGLNQFEWRLIINNTEYNHLKMFRRIDFMDNLHFITTKNDLGWQVYLEIVNFSWYPHFKIESFIYNSTFLEEFLIHRDINYFIHTLKESPYKRNVEEEYLCIKNIIRNYFTQKKYEYGDLIVYAKDF